MPELPEVETVVRGLRRVILGRTIASVWTNAPSASIEISRTLKARTLNAAIHGRTIKAVERRGKNILISLSGDLTLWAHLKMTGRFLYTDKNTPVDKHDLARFDFAPDKHADGCELRFNDYRRFGRLRVYPDRELWQQNGLARLGPEPLEITAEDFVALCYRRPRMIKPALLDQSFVAGLGNIYADESLYAARIHPCRLTTSISRRKLIELHGHIQRLLRKAIELMGTSVDTYAGVNGQPGSFQNYLRVYGKENLPCERCGATILRRRIGSRSAHYCPRCQRERE